MSFNSPLQRCVSDLPLLAANVLQKLASENGEQGFVCPLACDELEVMARAWENVGFSIRKLKKNPQGYHRGAQCYRREALNFALAGFSRPLPGTLFQGG